MRVFLSYSHKDIDVAQRVEEGLKAEGFDVYRDASRITEMTHWTRELAKELSERDVLILLWSDAAAESRWVRSEWMTARALEQGIIVCLLDPAEQLKRESSLPGDLGQYQYIQLGRGDSGDPRPGIGRIAGLLREPERIPRKWTYAAPPKNFFVPFPINPNFVGRKDLMLELYLLFLGNLGPVGINQAAVAFGMGGIGKTQLAAEFCWRYSFAFPDGVLWINGARSLISEFSDAAYRLGISVDRPEAHDATQRLLAKLQGHVSRHPQLLLVLDNLANPADVNNEVVPGFRPSGLGCSLLVTTRRQDLPVGMCPVRVDVLSPAESMALLSKALPPASEAEKTSAAAICERLGHLPLAVEMVASFVSGQRGAVGYGRYLRHLQDRIATLDSTAASRPLMTHDAALFAVFEQQYESVQNHDARLLFQIAGQMDEAELVPRRRLELLSAVSDDGTELVPRFSAALNELFARSLVEELKHGQVRLHPLVWEYARSLLPGSKAIELRSACADRFSLAIPATVVLEREYVLRGRDVDGLLDDLGLAYLWATRGDTRSAVSTMLLPLDRERHNLRGGNWRAPRLSFFQQVAYRASRAGLDRVVRDASCFDEVVFLPVHLRTADDPALVRTFKGHADQVTAVAFSPDSRYALSGSWDGTLRLWDVRTGRGVRAFSGHKGEVRAVAFSPDGQRALSGASDRKLMLWDVLTGEVMRTFRGHSDRVTSVAFSPDGQHVLSGSEDRKLILWDVASGEVLRVFRGHANWVESVAFSPEGRHVLSGSQDETLTLWNVETGEAARTFNSHSGIVNAVALSPDGGYALSGSWNRALTLWEVESGETVRTFEGHADIVNAVAFSPDGRHALSGSDDKSLLLWDVTTGKAVRGFKGHSSGVTAAAFSKDGRYALSGSRDTTLMLWDMTAEEHVPSSRGHARAVAAVSFSPDGMCALSGSRDKTLMLWDVLAGKAVRTFEGHTYWVGSVSFSPDGRHAASGGDDQNVILWDVLNGRATRVLKGHRDAVTTVEFSSHGRVVLSGSRDKTLMLWDVATGEVVRLFEGHTHVVTAASFSRDGRYVLSGSWDRTLRLWDVATGSQLGSFQGHSDRVGTLAFSPDGRHVLSGSWDKTLKLWDVATGAVVRTFTGHTDRVRAVAFSPDGCYALSGSADGTLVLWEVGTGDVLMRLSTSAVVCSLDWRGHKAVLGLQSGEVEFFKVRLPRNPDASGTPRVENG